jgi:membrane protease YdiL (CAAX protease family)
MNHVWNQVETFLLPPLAVALLALGVWYFYPGARRRLLPPPRERAVPWGGAELFFGLFLVLFVWPALVYYVLDRLGVFTRSPEQVALFLGAAPQAPFPGNEPWTALALHTRQAVTENFSRPLWVQTLAFPLMALTLPVLFRLASGTRPEQLGLTLERSAPNFLAGVLAWVTFTPFTYATLSLVSWLYSRLVHVAPEEHPLTQLGHQPLGPMERFLVVLSAVVLAPVVEELVFRGAVQPWVARPAADPAPDRPPGPLAGLDGLLDRPGVRAAVVVLVAFTLALGARSQKLEPAWRHHDTSAFLHEATPALFVLAVAPGLLPVWWLSRSRVAVAVYATALFFAAAHSSVWPTPVPLFVLGLALGLLYHRTQSLVAPVVLHGLFNAVGCVILFWPQTAPPG